MENDCIMITWTIQDVISHGREMYPKVRISKRLARELLEEIEHNHDASIGINWGVIEEAIVRYLQDHPGTRIH